jgi:hypothetical protein
MTNQTLLKIGLVMVGVAIIHVAMFSGVLVVYHPDTKSMRDCQTACDAYCDDLLSEKSGSIAKDFSAGNVAYPVDTTALNELKHQIFRPRRQPSYQPSSQPDCPTCVQPSRLPTYVTPTTPTLVTPQRPAVRPAVKPAVQPTTPAVQPTTPAVSPRYEIALFLDGSAKSNTIAEWFRTNRNLASLRAKCDFQEYAANNAMYRTRFANIVPVNQFPAILFLKPDGGHVHAAGGRMIPGSADMLYADLKEGYRLSRSVEAAEAIPDNSGVIREAGYSWDSQISPSMQLQNPQDCPDGVCPLPDDEDDRWRPGDRARDLFDRVPSRNAILWASPIEIAVFVVLGLIVLLAIAAIIKKR